MNTKFKNFEQLTACAREKPGMLRCAVVAAHEESILDALIQTTRDNIAIPTLIGDSEFIKAYLDKKEFDFHQVAIIEERDPVAAANIAVDLVHNGEAQCIMKGEIKTAALMKVILKADNDLRTGRTISSLSIRELPNYHKLLGFADTGVCIAPSLNEKCQIIENSVDVLLSIGVERPKVAVACAIEYVNPKMPETLEAEELKHMNQAGIINDCIVEGPISYDLAVSKRSAQIKGYDSPVAGDADILVVPDIVAGNLVSKCLTCTGGSHTCGTVWGAKVPIILTSRSAATEDKYMSIILSAAAGGV